jgi:hypothetical protein
MKADQVNTVEAIPQPTVRELRELGYDSLAEGVFQRWHLQHVAELSRQYSFNLLPLLTQKDMADMHEVDAKQLRNRSVAEVAQLACDMAQAMFTEFQDRDWLVETRPPTKTAAVRE